MRSYARSDRIDGSQQKRSKQKNSNMDGHQPGWWLLNKINITMWTFLRNIVIFCWVSKVLRGCIGFVLLRFGIGPENAPHSLDQSDTKLNPIKTLLPAFSRASGGLLVFTLSSHWLYRTFSILLIGRCNYFGFNFMTLDQKVVQWNMSKMQVEFNPIFL